jgi:hypothetical protein
MQLRSRVLLIGLSVSLAALAQTPRLQTVEPPNGKPGDVLVVTGENLDAGHVAKLFLTIGEQDSEVEVKEQTAETIRFAIPANTKPGRYNLTVQTTGDSPTLMVQPVFCTVDE